MESLPLPLLVVLIVLAIVVGLWVGSRTQRTTGGPRAKDDKPWGARIRDAAGKGALSVFRWNRARKKKAKQAAKAREQD